jgi:hypothetical protein
MRTVNVLTHDHLFTLNYPLAQSDGTIGGLVGKLEVLRLECPISGRQGRYKVAHLLEELGPGARLTDWLHERTADCPQKSPDGPTRACGAVMPDLVDML